MINRKQYVFVCGNISETLDVTCGVPQGSVLGPLLFFIYINDLPKSQKAYFFLFADDTNIYYESSDLTEDAKSVNKELEKVRKWLESNRLALNISKTNFVTFHSPTNKPDSQISLKFGKKKISQETCVKFLGLLFDSNLSWKAHITDLTKKLSRPVGLFYKIRHYASLDILKLLYHGIFYPFLMYGIHVWGLTFNSYLEPISILQKKVLKSITFSDMMALACHFFIIYSCSN